MSSASESSAPTVLASVPIGRRALEAVALHRELLLKALTVAAIPLLVFFELFKFAPDLAATASGHGTSPLVSFRAYREVLTGIHASRFAANEIVYWLARAIGGFVPRHADVRLHPLRLAAALVAAGAILATLAPFLSSRQAQRWSWRTFALFYLPVAFLSLQVYKPYDLTSTAVIAFALLALFSDRFALAFGLMIVAGLFRETSLHVVWFALCFAWLRGGRRRLSWTAAMGLVWAAELTTIRHAFGVQTHVGLALALPPDFFNPSLWLSVLATLIATGYAAVDLASRRAAFDGTEGQIAWRFFALQVGVVVPWMIFYQIMGGGLAEFRLMLPVLLPLALSVAWRGERPAATVAPAVTQTVGEP